MKAVEKVPFREFCQQQRFVLAYQLKEWRERQHLSEVVIVLQAALGLVHCLQLERGTSTRWLGSTSEDHSSLLGPVIAQTDLAVSQFQRVSENLDRLTHGRRFLATVADAMLDLGRRLEFRESARQRRVDSVAVLEFYSEIISALMGIVARAFERCPLPFESQRLVTLYQLVLLKEKAGQERAVGVALLGPQFDSNLWSRFLALGADQDRATDTFLRHVDVAHRQRWESSQSHPSFAAVAQWRAKIRRARVGGYWPPGPSADWFREASTRIDLLHTLETSLLSLLQEELGRTSSELSRDFLSEGSQWKGPRRWWVRQTRQKMLRDLALREASSNFVRSAQKSGHLGDQKAFLLWTEAPLHNGSLAGQQRLEQRSNDARNTALSQAILSFTSGITETLSQMETSVEQSQLRAKSLGTVAEDNRKRSEEVLVVTHQSIQSVLRVTQSVRVLSTTLGLVRSRASECRAGATQSLTQTQAFDFAWSELSRVTKAIEDAVTAIVDIAGRINLLSLNAAIEAARAGNSGVGFAVVAREVKSLAQQTDLSAKGIVDGLVAVQSAAQSASGHTQAIRNSLVQIRDVFDVTTETLGREDQNVEGLAVHLNQVAGGAAQVETAMTALTESAVLTERAAELMEGEARDWASALRGIQDLVESFVTTVQKLR